MGLKRVMWVRRYQGQCRALRPLGHQGYRLRNHKKDQPLCSGYTRCTHRVSPPLGAQFLCWHQTSLGKIPSDNAKVLVFLPACPLQGRGHQKL